MKLELKYECDPTMYGDEDSNNYAMCEDCDISEGIFDTYEELLAFVVKHWDYRAYYALYIDVPDDVGWTKDTKTEIDELNERFTEDLKRIEASEMIKK